MLHVLMPPTFDYLPGVFAPDFLRADIAAALAASVATWRGAGRRVRLDRASRGQSAAETADGVASEGGAAVIVGGVFDRYAARILAEALRAREIDVSGVHCVDSPARATAAVSTIVGAPAGGAAGVAQRDPAWTFLDPSAIEAAPHAVGDRLRLAPSVPASWSADRPAWGVRYGFDRDRHQLLRVVASHFPAHVAAVRFAMQQFDCGLHPLAEMYAGRNLADRNADLLVNIVP